MYNIIHQFIKVCIRGQEILPPVLPTLVSCDRAGNQAERTLPPMLHAFDMGVYGLVCAVGIAPSHMHGIQTEVSK